MSNKWIASFTHRNVCGLRRVVWLVRVHSMRWQVTQSNLTTEALTKKGALFYRHSSWKCAYIEHSTLAAEEQSGTQHFTSSRGLKSRSPRDKALTF